MCNFATSKLSKFLKELVFEIIRKDLIFFDELIFELAYFFIHPSDPQKLMLEFFLSEDFSRILKFSFENY